MQDSTPRIIAVDLTPVLPGGENGGAKVFVIELLHRLAAMVPDTHFLLLTQSASHEELGAMDRANVSRHLVSAPAVAGAMRTGLQNIARRALPHLPMQLRGLASQVGYRIHTALKRSGGTSFLRRLEVDLLFCPFTAPAFFEPGVATVCVVYDLQHNTYPWFFAADDIANRHWSFQEACRRADTLVAISEYTRTTAIQVGRLDPERIQTIHLRLAQRLAGRPAETGETFAQLGLADQRYLLYPANFWKHKNHEMLLTAFGIACRKGLAPDIRLVCTGAPGERQRELASAAKAMGLAGRVLFPGFLSSRDLSEILSRARGVIFPSLYEGFGLPIIEAMTAGVPLACSNTTALPEIAGDAALLFDPRVPAQISDAMLRLALDERIRFQLIGAGLQRALAFGDADRMAEEYWQLFRSAIARRV
ncbi:glycosyltransferase family 4 protein [Thiocapsa marina]|uniref:Glycosyl transferase group 1 n=1 Tax=Thiocapsa marina 5811 TaxID=768671 RepID=F9U978_9GAMM|nr:glycosyltransferase family 1 protein [Thiocapsa marina]EGV19336.1 glycosyl transferase group 1 [Thiocapsa marina 5811]